jgi:hypothetical protein
LIDGYSEIEILYDTGKTPGDDNQQSEVRIENVEKLYYSCCLSVDIITISTRCYCCYCSILPLLGIRKLGLLTCYD